MRKTSLKSKTKLKSKTFIKKKGKKSNEWSDARKSVLDMLARLGIQSCELGWEGCNKNWFLTLAHSRKRRKINSLEKLKEVILACQKCHYTLEGLPQEEMEKIVMEVIAKR